MVSTEGDGADLFEEMVAVSVLTVFRGLVVKAGVVHDRDAVSGSVGNPQLVGATGMEFHVRWLIEVIGCISDDHFNKTVAKGVHHLRVFGLGGVGRECEEEKEHKGKGDLLLLHTINQRPFAFDMLLFKDAHASQKRPWSPFINSNFGDFTFSQGR